MKGIIIYLKKNKTKRINTPVNDLGIFLRKRKTKTQKYGTKQYKNLPENEKQRLTESNKNYSKMEKNKEKLMFSGNARFFI